MKLEEFRTKVRQYRRAVEYSQEKLADELNIHSTVLSNKLNGTNGARLTQYEIKKIIQVLAMWQAISTQAEALELLELAGLKKSHISFKEWNSMPLSRLEATKAEFGQTEENPQLQQGGRFGSIQQAAGSSLRQKRGTSSSAAKSQPDLPPSLTLVPLDPQLEEEDSEGAAIPVTFREEEVSLPSTTPTEASRTPQRPAKSPYRREKVDWGEAPDTTVFYGREAELARLEHWVEDEHCRLLAILGIGGIGKTTLAVRLAHKLKDQFEFVIWQSLYNAPSLKEVISNCLKTLKTQAEPAFLEVVEPQSKDLARKQAELFEYLRHSRCLLILDNLETLLLPGTSLVGNYRPGFEAYRSFFQKWGEMAHQSCLLLTSREKPREISLMEGKRSPVRTYQLAGLGYEESREILEDKELSGSESAWAELVERYRGNPLALKLIATPIRELYAGNINSFLQLVREETVFGDISKLIGQQFERLTSSEKAVMYWLAIGREPLSLEELLSLYIASLEPGFADPAPLSPKKAFVEAVESLCQRSLVERVPPLPEENRNSPLFTLQPVLLEFVTERLVEAISEELARGELALISTHTLMLAQAKEYVRNSQCRLLLQPVADRLTALLKNRPEPSPVRHLSTLLEKIREPLKQAEREGHTSYTAGNLINLLYQLAGDLSGLDFSRLSIRQASFRGVGLIDTSLAGSTIRETTFTESFGAVLAISYSPDGKFMAAACDNGEIRVWQTMDNSLLFTYQEQPRRPVRTLAFSPDSLFLASAGESGTIKIWKLSTGQCWRTLHGHIAPIRSLAFSSEINHGTHNIEITTIPPEEASTVSVSGAGASNDATPGSAGPTSRLTSYHLASSGDDQSIKLWDLLEGKCLQTLLGHKGRVGALSFNPLDPEQLVSAGNDGILRLWNLARCEELKTFSEHTRAVTTVAFSPDGTLLASGSYDRTILLWEVATGRCLKRLLGHTHRVNGVVFDPTGKNLASGSGDQSVKLWSVERGECLKTLEGHSDWVKAVAFEPVSGKVLVSGGDDQTVRLWETTAGRTLLTLEGHTAWVGTVAFNPKGTLVVSAGEDQQLNIWETASGKYLRSLKGHKGLIFGICISPDGKMIASSAQDGTVKLWSLEQSRSVRTLEIPGTQIRTLGISPDGTLLATGGENGEVYLWKIADEGGERVATLEAHTQRVLSVCFQPPPISLKNVGEKHAENQTKGIPPFILATAGADQTIKLWEIGSGKCSLILKGHTDWIRSLAFDPFNPTILVSSGDDRTIRLWDLSSGECLQVLEGHSDRVRAVTFVISEGGERLVASASEDHTIRVWHPTTGSCQGTLSGHTGPVRALAAGPTANLVASASEDGTTRLWNVMRGSLLKTLRGPRPYEGLDLTGTKGLTQVQIAGLKILGAIER